MKGRTQIVFDVADDDTPTARFGLEMLRQTIRGLLERQDEYHDCEIRLGRNKVITGTLRRVDDGFGELFSIDGVMHHIGDVRRIIL